MPFGEKVSCCKCNVTESVIWHQASEGITCNTCNEIEKTEAIKKQEEEEDEKEKEVQSEKSKEETKVSAQAEKLKPSQRRNTRSRATRSGKSRQNQGPASKGKGRRHIFKKTTPVKLTSAGATIVTMNELCHEGQYFRVGDIVSLRGASLRDPEVRTYYAQIKGLMMDEYCEKSASLTWLLPTRTRSPFFPEGSFDPLTFIIGPDDDLPRKIDCMEFVMHAPSEYFRSNCPFPTGAPPSTPPGFIWTRLQLHEKD